MEPRPMVDNIPWSESLRRKKVIEIELAATKRKGKTTILLIVLASIATLALGYSVRTDLASPHRSVFFESMLVILIAAVWIISISTAWEWWSKRRNVGNLQLELQETEVKIERESVSFAAWTTKSSSS